MSSSKRQRLAIVTPAADPARAALSAAIKTQARAAKVIAEKREQVERAKQRITEAENGVELARGNVVEAKEQAADALADGASPPALTVAEAREALVAAEDAVGIATTALERARANVREAELNERIAAAEVNGAINAVVAPRMAEMVARAEQASAVLCRTTAALRALSEQVAVVTIPNDAPLDWRERNALTEQQWPVPPDLRERLDHLLRSRVGWSLQFDVPDDVRAHAASWTQARAALRNNANAEVPEI